jgi:hypothetical protein
LNSPQTYADGRRLNRQDQQDIEDNLGVYKGLRKNKITPRRDEQINVGLTESLKRACGGPLNHRISCLIL